MDANRMKWKNEMEKMLAAINRETAHSLCVIRSIFKQCGLSLPPDFKQYFLQSSSNRIKTTYEQFEIDSLFEESMNVSLGSVANVAGGSSNRGQSGRKSEASNSQDDVVEIDDSDDDENEDGIKVENGTPTNVTKYEIEIDTVVAQMSSEAHNNELMATDDSHEIEEPIPHQSKTIEIHAVHPEVSSDSNFAVEMDESIDSSDMFGNQSESSGDDDIELNPVNAALNRLDKSTIAVLAKAKRRATRLNRKNPNEKRMTTTTGAYVDKGSFTSKGRTPVPRQLASKKDNRKICTVCGFAALHMGVFKRHMRSHTGEKPYGCDRCGKRFASAEGLMKHAATHIGDFPFTCRVCFQGFSVKAEAKDHEIHCQKRRYECYLCKKYVTCNKSQLIIHMRTHTGDKPFRCEICMLHFGRKYILKRHLNTIHA